MANDDKPNLSAKRMVGADGSSNVAGEELVIVPGESLATKADEVATLLAGLRESVAHLAAGLAETDKRATTSFDRATTSYDRASKSEKTADRARRTARVAAGVLLVVAVLVAGLASIAFGNRSTIERLDAQQRRLDSLIVRLDTQVRESCVLYEILLSTATPGSRERSTLGPDGYDRAIARIQRSVVNLQCSTG